MAASEPLALLLQDLCALGFDEELLESLATGDEAEADATLDRLLPGSEVTLTGLSKAELNGRTGVVMDGPPGYGSATAPQWCRARGACRRQGY